MCIYMYKEYIYILKIYVFTKYMELYTKCVVYLYLFHFLLLLFHIYRHSRQDNETVKEIKITKRCWTQRTVVPRH